jgi:hypothetical protein
MNVGSLTFRLRTLLQKAGLALQRQEDAFSPFGKLCQVRKGMNGSSLAEYETISAENVAFILEHTADSMSGRGILEIPPGNPMSAEAIQMVLQEIKAGLQDEGAIIHVAYFVVRWDESTST